MDQNKEISIEQQIYNDVYSAQDLLIAHANEILATKVCYDEEKYNRLTALLNLGFSNAKDIKEHAELAKSKKEAEELSELIAYYKATYPFNKFIDRNSVDAICEKYKLVLAFARDYIDDIPDKNQKEIVAFTVCRKDIREPYEMHSNNLVYRAFNFYSPYSEEYGKQRTSGKELLIIAPPHKLDMKGKVLDGNILKNEDPIVLQPVKEGYLIISSWGLEAGDELVVNAINN